MAQLKDLIVYGDTKFLGDVTLDHDPTAALHAATKAYVDAQVGTGTDEKLKVAALTSGTTYLPILAISTDSGTAATRQIDKNAQALKYICTPGTSGGSTKGTAQLILGNSISEGYVNSAAGQLTIYGNAMYGVTLKYGAAYSEQILMLPAPTDASQTNYLLSKIGSAAVGAANQPVYFDAMGHATAANKNPWFLTPTGGMVNVDANDYSNWSLLPGTIVNSTSSNISSSIQISYEQPRFVLASRIYLDLQSSAPVNSTSYVIQGRNFIDGSQFPLDELYYYFDNEAAAQKPTSFTADTLVPESAFNATLNFDSTLNPNNAVTRVWHGHYIESSSISIGSAHSLKTKGQPMFAAGFRISSTNGYKLLIGNSVLDTGAYTVSVGFNIKNSAQMAAIFGRAQNNTSTYALIAGRGHNNTAGTEGITAVGMYSSISTDSLLVIGNGTAADARSNAFEVTTTGEAKAVSFTENGTSLVNKYAAKTHTHNLGITTGTSSDTSQLTLAHGTKYVLSAGGSTYCFTMPSAESASDTKVTQSAITGTSTTSLYPLLLAYGTGQTATTTNTANFTANASVSPSGDFYVNKVTSSTTFNYGANAYTQYNAVLKAIEFCFA